MFAFKDPPLIYLHDFLNFLMNLHLQAARSVEIETLTAIVG